MVQGLLLEEVTLCVLDLITTIIIFMFIIIILMITDHIMVNWKSMMVNMNDLAQPLSPPPLLLEPQSPACDNQLSSPFVVTKIITHCAIIVIETVNMNHFD